MQNRSKVSDEIIISQMPHHDRYRLGYNQIEKGSSSKTTNQEKKPRSYIETITRSPEKEEHKKFHKEYHIDTPPPKRFIFQNQQQPEIKNASRRRRIQKINSF